MRPIEPYPLWIGHAGDARDLRSVLSAGIHAIVDLAVNEPPASVTRELTYCRFPLMDGGGNPPWLLRLAIDTVAALIRSGTPTLVCCSAGMSRSVAIVAAALAAVSGRPAAECLTLIATDGPSDVSPRLWRDCSTVLL